jgi:hypothetical protein
MEQRWLLLVVLQSNDGGGTSCKRRAAIEPNMETGRFMREDMFSE